MVVIAVDEITVNAAFTPPKRTSVVLEKFVPEMRMDVPGSPWRGFHPVIDGANGDGTRSTMNALALAIAPLGVVTEMVADGAPAGTRVTIKFVDTTVEDSAVTPPKRTEMAPKKFSP
jgi:hypothetical protein